mgnify:FL=1|tara:strand:+ start:934 stop:1617 length:684 start_codon:yes stop_codon:yes gene_type:complete
MHIIIYSRVSSNRLSEKALIKLSNQKKLIEQVICQAKLIVPKKKIILATTKKKEDLKLCKIAQKYKINYFRGSNNDLISRTLDCCKKFKVSFFFRYCADRPIIDVKKIKKCISNSKKIRFDLMTTNYLNNKIDEGFTIEIFNATSLKKMASYKLNNNDKEHIANYFYKKRKIFDIKKIKFSKKFKKGYKYTIDTFDDLSKMNFILKNYNPNNISSVVGLSEKYEKLN